jgi:hypothetical protein
MPTTEDPKETLDQLMQQSETKMLQIHKLVNSWLPAKTAGSASSRSASSSLQKLPSALASLAKPSPASSSSINVLYTKNSEAALNKNKARQGFSNIIEQRKRLCGSGSRPGHHPQYKNTDKKTLESDESSDEEDSKGRSSSNQKSREISRIGQKRPQDMLSQYLNRKGAKKLKK